MLYQSKLFTAGVTKQNLHWMEHRVALGATDLLIFQHKMLTIFWKLYDCFLPLNCDTSMEYVVILISVDNVHCQTQTDSSKIHSGWVQFCTGFIVHAEGPDDSSFFFSFIPGLMARSKILPVSEELVSSSWKWFMAATCAQHRGFSFLPPPR